MARDVSAFANGDGGQIVYGMTENKDHEPAGLDNGFDPKVYPEIWFEQALQQHITPAIRGLKIRHVPLGEGFVAVVIDIPNNWRPPSGLRSSILPAPQLQPTENGALRGTRRLSSNCRTSSGVQHESPRWRI
jgi:hypothetical protein